MGGKRLLRKALRPDGSDGIQRRRRGWHRFCRSCQYSQNIVKHARWAQEIQSKYTITADNVEEILHKEIGQVFAEVLEDAGVYKMDQQGRAGFVRFLASVK